MQTPMSYAWKIVRLRLVDMKPTQNEPSGTGGPISVHFDAFGMSIRGQTLAILNPSDHISGWPGISTVSWVIPRGPAERRREKAMMAASSLRGAGAEAGSSWRKDSYPCLCEGEKRGSYVFTSNPTCLFFYIWFRSGQRSTRGRKVEWWLKAYDIRFGRERERNRAPTGGDSGEGQVGVEGRASRLSVLETQGKKACIWVFFSSSETPSLLF